MPKKTEHYQLNQYEPQDKFIRADFNEDNAKIDAALARKAEAVAGTYTGSGAASREIALGFRPKAVLVAAQNGRMNTGYQFYGGLALDGSPAEYREGSTLYPIVTVTDNGFAVYNRQISTSYFIYSNSASVTFHYLALR